MAKMNVNVDNGLDDVVLESTDKLKSKKVKKEKKESKKKKNKGNGEKKVSYLSEVRKELKLVTWPTRKNVIKYSFATVLVIAFLALFFIGISLLFNLLYNLVQGWIG